MGHGLGCEVGEGKAASRVISDLRSSEGPDATNCSAPNSFF